MPAFVESAEKSAFRITVLTLGKNRRATHALATLVKRYDDNTLIEAEITELEALLLRSTM